MSALRTTAVALCFMGGMRPCEISQVTGSTWPFIRGIRRQLGIPPFPSGRKPGEYWKPEIIQRVRETREAALSQKQIVKRLGIHPQRVMQLMVPLKHRARVPTCQKNVSKCFGKVPGRVVVVYNNAAATEERRKKVRPPCGRSVRDTFFLCRPG
jgi:hypothetical protein